MIDLFNTVSSHLVISLVVGSCINVFLKEASSRWLKPLKVCSILRDHEWLLITHEPPNMPSSIAHLLNFDKIVFTSIFTWI